MQLFDLQNEGVFSPQSSSVKSEEADYNRAPKRFSSYYSAYPFCPASILFTQLISFNEPPESDWQNIRGIHSSINRKEVLCVLESAPPGNAPDAGSTRAPEEPDGMCTPVILTAVCFLSALLPSNYRNPRGGCCRARPAFALIAGAPAWPLFLPANVPI